MVNTFNHFLFLILLSLLLTLGSATSFAGDCSNSCSARSIYEEGIPSIGAPSLRSLSTRDWRKLNKPMRSAYVEELKQSGIRLRGREKRNINSIKRKLQQSGSWGRCKRRCAKERAVSVSSPPITQSLDVCETKDCTHLAKLTLSERGMGKMIKMAFNQNRNMINTNVVKRGQLIDMVLLDTPKDCAERPSGKAADSIIDVVRSGDRRCLGFPLMSEDGMMNLSESQPAKIYFSNSKLKDIDVEMVEDPLCMDYRCKKLKVQMNRLRADGKLNIINKDSGEKIMSSANMSLSIKEDQPIEYEVDALMEFSSDRLSDLVRADRSSSRAQIPQGTLDLKLRDKNGNTSIDDSIRSYYQKELSSEYLNMSSEDFEKQLSELAKGLRRQKISTKEIKERTHILRQDFKRIQSEVLGTGSSDAARSRLLDSIPKDFYRLPASIQRQDIAVQKFTEEEPEKYGLKNLNELVLYGFSTQLSDAFFSTDKGAEMLSEKVDDYLPIVADNINQSMEMLPYFLDKALRVPLPSADAMIKRNSLIRKRNDLVDQYESAGTQEKISILYALDELDPQIKAADAESRKQMADLNLQYVVEQSQVLNDAVDMDIYSGPPMCRQQSMIDGTPVTEGEEPFDARMELSLEAFNEYFKQMHEAGNLKLCTDPNENYDKCKAWAVDLDQPKVEFDGENYVITLKDNKAGWKKHPLISWLAKGKGSVQAKVKPRSCQGGHSICLETVDVKGKAQFLIFPVGTALENATRTAMQSADTNGMRIPDPFRVSQLKTNPTTGALIVDWELTGTEFRRP